jgi:hypothetical protein
MYPACNLATFHNPSQVPALSSAKNSYSNFWLKLEVTMAIGDMLQIYDAGAKTKIWHNSLFEPRSDASFSLGVKTEKELHEGLTKLVAAEKTFSKVLFETHGQSGIIFLGDPIGYYSFSGDPRWTDSRYDKLFPFDTKIVFGGCNVAEGNDGWKFLENAGKLLLRKGGYTLGWTSLGFHLFEHDMHFWGDWRRVNISPGGFVRDRRAKNDLVPDINRPWDNRWR